MIEKTCSLLEDDLQAKWTFLTSSIGQKLTYHQSLQYPSDMWPHVERLDTILWRMIEAATGLHIPQPLLPPGPRGMWSPVAASSILHRIVSSRSTCGRMSLGYWRDWW